VTTNRETYVVELKDALPEGAYELAWSRVYDLERSSK
jgi:methionine-rich copper-binding protein CopC